MASATPKVALITGGGSGIGRATAIKFSTLGYSVVVADLSLASAKETVTQLKGDSLALEVDVSKEADVKKMIDLSVAKFGRLDACFNNAGISGTKSEISNYPLDIFDQVMSINLKGIFICMKHEITQLMKQELANSNNEFDDSLEINVATIPVGLTALAKKQPIRGYIVNTSSIAGLKSFPLFSPYSASKWGVIGLTKTAALEYAASGVLINCICPATTATPMVQGFTDKWPEIQKQINSQYIVGRILTPGEVAESVCWLCSGKCTYMVGECLTLSGGVL